MRKQTLPQKKLSRLAFLISALVLGGCSGGGSSTLTTTPTSNANNTPVSGLETPDQVDVITAKQDTGATTMHFGRKLGRAYDSASTNYSKDEQHFHMWHPALEPIENVNNILCFIGQLKPGEFVNAGNYVALVDKNKCEKGSGDSSSQGNQSSSSSSSTPNYVKVLADSTRTSSTEPMEVKFWIPEMGDDGHAQSIKAKITVKEAPTDAKPLGDFRMAFQMEDPDHGYTTIGGGDLYTQTSGALTGFQFYEHAGMGGFNHTTSASLLGAANGTSGTALTYLNESGSGMGGSFSKEGTFGLAFDTTHVLSSVLNNAKGNRASEVLSNSGGACLSRTSLDEAVWRYNLYNKTTGARIKLNSGFPFKYTDSDHKQRFGYVGYWGVWAERGNELADGTVISKQTFGNNGAATDSYTIKNTPGKLIKHTVKKAALTELAGVEFQYWDQNLMSDSRHFDQWIVEYDAMALKFQIVAGIKWSHDGPPTKTNLTTPVDVTPSTGNTLNMWSQQLGGNVLYKGGDSIIYNAEEVVSKPESDLYFTCVERCTKAELTPSDVQNPWSGPYTDPRQTPVMGLITPVVYHFSKDDMSLKQVPASGPEVAVEYPIGGTTEGWGIRSGHLFEKANATAAGASLNNMAAFALYNFNEGDTFYEWEVGPHNWNKLTQVINTGTNEVETFDKPIEFSYTHSATDDRDQSSGRNTSFDGQRFLLSYQGDGQLHGIPFEAKIKSSDGKHKEEGDTEGGDDNRHVRWYPQFNLKDGVVLGESGQYVAKAIDIEQMMTEDAGHCGSLSFNADLTLPNALKSTHESDILSVGDMPTLTEAQSVAKVIGGEVQ